MNDQRWTVWLLGVGTFALVASGTAVGQSPIFRAATTYSLPGDSTTTFYLSSLVVADVGSPDGPPDTIPDLIAANFGGSGSIAAVMVGNGDGTFQAGPSTPLATIPTALAVGDFDNDGFNDLLVADVGNLLSFFRNPDGQGPPFEPPPFPPPTPGSMGNPVVVGQSPAAIVVTDYHGNPFDLDGDTKRDLIVVNGGSTSLTGSVTLVFGNDDGTFRVGTTITTGQGSSGAVVGEFTGDNKLDIAVSNAGSNNVTILKGNGLGGFILTQTVPAGDEPVGIVAADFHKTGRADLIVVDRNLDQVGILDGRADHTFADARFFPSGNGGTPNGLSVADLDLDGNLDVVVCNKFSSDVSILLGDGKGKFGGPRAFVTDQEPLAVVAQDFDNDPNHLPEIVTLNQSGSVPTVAVLIGQGGGNFAGIEDVLTQPSPSGITAGDVNNDGLSDLLVAHSSGNVLIYLADAHGGFESPIVKKSAGDAVFLGRGDFNGDGRLDVVAVNRAAMNVSVFLGRADGSLADPLNYTTGESVSVFAVGDWNQDGRDDLAVARSVPNAQDPSKPPSGAVDILLADPHGALVPSGTSLAITAAPATLGSGDFNNDHKVDLVVASSTDLFMLLGNADGTFQAATTVAFPGGTQAMTVADFDRDGSLDLALGQATDPSLQGRPGIAVIFGDGHGGFGLIGPHLGLSGSPSSLTARDVNGDFIPDVLVADQVSNVVAVFLGTGARSLHQAESDVVSRGPVSIVAADVDGDGRYDVATANNFVAGSASVLTNVSGAAVLRGDGNNDGRVGAADLVSVLRQVLAGGSTQIEAIHKAGGSAGLDANGDGVVTQQDALGIAHRLFAGM